MLYEDILVDEHYWYFNTNLLMKLPERIQIKVKKTFAVYYNDARGYMQVANKSISSDLFHSEEDALLKFMIIYYRDKGEGFETFVDENEKFNKVEQYILNKYPESFI